MFLGFRCDTCWYSPMTFLQFPSLAFVCALNWIQVKLYYSCSLVACVVSMCRYRYARGWLCDVRWPLGRYGGMETDRLLCSGFSGERMDSFCGVSLMDPSNAARAVSPMYAGPPHRFRPMWYLSGGIDSSGKVSVWRVACFLLISTSVVRGSLSPRSGEGPPLPRVCLLLLLLLFSAVSRFKRGNARTPFVPRRPRQQTSIHRLIDRDGQNLTRIHRLTRS